MARTAELGRLVIAWGPQSASYLWDPRDPNFDHAERERLERPIRRPHVHTHWFHDFHADAVNDDRDPFMSKWFGQVVKALLTGSTTVLSDRAFDDPQRRRLVERSFRRVFPDLVIEHVLLGADPDTGSAAEAEAGIVIDDDVYEEGVMGANERIVVESDSSRDVVMVALATAAERMMSVGDDGQELGHVGTLVGGDTEIYTPNYVSEVTVDEAGNPGFYIDCKGGIEPPMATRFRAILIEELQRHGVSSARVRVPDAAR